MRDIRICKQCEHNVDEKRQDVDVHRCGLKKGDRVAGCWGDQAARKVPEDCQYFFEHVVNVQGHETERRYGTPKDWGHSSVG